MSEYWKSTPKYWCKHCKTFVRDTKLEKSNHEATPKHQGNLKRFLRDLHRGHEKDEKDKERAKAEIARLNGLSSSGGSSMHASSSSSGTGRVGAPSLPKSQATPAQRKQQLAQLAEMGISIPDEFRPDMAMAGEWQVTSERIIEAGDGEKDTESIALGVRKRIVEEEEEEAVEAKKRRWGSTYKTHPKEDDEADLDALLSNVTRKGKEPLMKTEIKEEPDLVFKEEAGEAHIRSPDGIKKEQMEGEILLPVADLPLNSSLKQEGEDVHLAGVIFKKRKAKNIRQK